MHISSKSKLTYLSIYHIYNIYLCKFQSLYLIHFLNLFTSKSIYRYKNIFIYVCTKYFHMQRFFTLMNEYIYINICGYD